MKTTTFKLAQIILYIVFLSLFNYGLVKAQDCLTLDRDTTEFTELPWFDNSDYLQNLRNEFGYPLNDPCPTCRVEPGAVVRYRIPVKIWVYRDNNGNGGPDEVQIQRMLDFVNEQHRARRTGIRFYLKCGISEIRDDSKLSLSDLESYFVSNWLGGRQDIGAVNIHLVQNIQSGSNFYSPFTHSIFIRWADITPNTIEFSTFTHEIGHFLGLDHPHQYSDYNFVARTCFREPVDHSRTFAGINFCFKPRGRRKCESTGDALCDTPADPNIRTTFSCTFPNTYAGTDLYGDSYANPPAGNAQPDVTNIMGYYDRGCRNNITPDQIAVMLHSIERPLGRNNPSKDGWTNPNTVFDTFEPNETQQTARVMNVGQSEELTFHWQYNNSNYSSCDVDWIRFTPSSAALIRITTYIAGAYDRPNTRLTLFDNAGNQIAQNDDANGTQFSQIDISNLTPGSEYFVRIENLSGYPSDESHGRYTFSIAAPQPPAIVVAINGPTYVGACERGEWTASVSGGTGTYTYEWFVNSAFVSPSNFYARYNDNTFTEIFTLEVRVSDGVNQVSDYKSVYFDGCPSGSRTFLVYPNPATDQVNVEFRDNADRAKGTSAAKAENFEVSLFNERTQQMANAKTAVGSNIVRIDVKNLAPGTYFLHIFYNETVIKKQIVIKR